MADPVEAVNRIRARWPEDRRAAFDRLLESLADRFDELAKTQGSALVGNNYRVHKGVIVEARLERDERFA